MTKTTKQVVYKVLREDLASWTPPDGCSLRYSLSKLNRPKIPKSKFFVFITLEQAKEYDKRVKYLRKRIFRCEATGLEQIGCRMPLNKTVKEVAQFWKGGGFDLDARREDHFVCRTLKLLEEIFT